MILFVLLARYLSDVLELCALQGKKLIKALPWTDRARMDYLDWMLLLIVAVAVSLAILVFWLNRGPKH